VEVLTLSSTVSCEAMIAVVVEKIVNKKNKNYKKKIVIITKILIMKNYR
jgi:hypothetical protein